MYNVAAGVVVFWPQNLYLLRMKNQCGHWVCWMSTRRNGGLMWRTHIHSKPHEARPPSKQLVLCSMKAYRWHSAISAWTYTRIYLVTFNNPHTWYLVLCIWAITRNRYTWSICTRKQVRAQIKWKHTTRPTWWPNGHRAWLWAITAQVQLNMATNIGFKTFSVVCLA